jgi:2-(1,2-epoxy-1,2-dihydrophenyl)acetyl-CoA isomerase
VEDAELALTVETLATRLADMPLAALVATRQALADAQQLDLRSALAMEAELQGRLGGANDYREGVEAFRAKRPPRFTDR